MAISTNSPEKTTPEQQNPSQQPAPDNPNPINPDPTNSAAAPPSATPAITANATVVTVNPTLTFNSAQPTPSQPPQIQSYVPPSQVSTLLPSYRPAALSVPPSTTPQFSPIPNALIQNYGIQGQGQLQVQVHVQPPGVMMQPPSQASGAMSSIQQMMPPQYGQPGQQPMRMYAPMPNGYQMAAPQGTMNPPGILRYASPYPQMMRPAYPQRPLGPMGVIPALPRPPVMPMRGPVVPTIIRPPISAIPPAEKPMTTVYVGKIASSVDNEFMLSLLQLCGPVKSWKRVPDPTTGALKGFGFCEFGNVEGVLRALRLLSKLSIDGQELMLNFDKATKEYLKSYVEKKKENLKNTEGGGGKEEEKKEESKKEDDKNESEDYSTFGLVSNEDKEADKEATEKLTGMIEERIKNKPLPPPPPPPQTAPDTLPTSTPEHSDVDTTRNAEDKTEEDLSKSNERPETSSPDRSRRSKDRERDLKREKERELERYEREREQERAKREREREYKTREEERRYRARLKEWENREKEKEKTRKQEREWEKEKEQDRRYEIIDQENDEGYNGKKRKYKNSGEDREERKRRLREKEEDMEDRVREEEEVAEAKRKEEEERELQKEQQKHALEILSSNSNNNNNGSESNAMLIDGIRSKAFDQGNDADVAHETGNRITQNGDNEGSETRQQQQTKKLGFGLVGSGKRTAVPSLFHEEEDEDAQKDKKMRPLVPIDYSTEELQAVRGETASPPNNLAAAAEFAKRIGNTNSKDADSDRDRNRRSHRDRDHRNHEDHKAKTPDNKKLLDAKQLIDTIPKTKDELFSYVINWGTYDKNGLHERMRPWISKKITEFLGEEETTLVDYIVSSTQEHVTADEMLDRLQSILDDEAEMFVLKMWRMLIFEIKKLDTGLAARPTKP